MRARYHRAAFAAARPATRHANGPYQFIRANFGRS